MTEVVLYHALCDWYCVGLIFFSALRASQEDYCLMPNKNIFQKQVIYLPLVFFTPDGIVFSLFFSFCFLWSLYILRSSFKPRQVPARLSLYWTYTQKHFPMKHVAWCETHSVCVDDGWFKQPHLAKSDWNLGLGEIAHWVISASNLHTHLCVSMYNFWQTFTVNQSFNFGGAQSKTPMWRVAWTL